MDQRLHELERQVADLARAVEQLRERLDAVPAGQGLPPPLLSDVPLAPIDGAAAQPLIPLVGRSLLVVAGAFVVRLITERGLVPGMVGVALGLAFAAVWVALGARDAGRGQRLSAAVHAVTASVIGFSLLFETGTRPGGPPPLVSVLLLAGFTAGLLWLSWRHRLPEVAALAQVGGVVTGVALSTVPESSVGALVVLGALAAATLVLADRRQWPLLRWPVALALDVVLVRQVFSLSALAEAERGGRLGPVVAITVAVVALYLADLAFGTWVRHRGVRTFEVTQTVLALTVGLVVMTRVQGPAGPLGLALAAVALVTAVRVAALERRRFDAGFHAVLAVGLWLASAPLLASGSALGLWWACGGVALAVLGRWRLTGVLWCAAAALCLAAAAPAGAFGVLVSGLARAPAGAWPDLSAGAAAVFALALAAWAAMTFHSPGPAKAALRAPATVVLLLAVLGAAAAVSHLTRQALGDQAASAVVLVRTVLVCAGAAGLALARRLKGPVELGWAAWSLVLLGGLKVLVQDLSAGSASTLVVAFVALGLTLLAVSRWLKVAAAP